MRKMFAKPEVRRWFIIAIVFIAIVFNYIDRQIVSVLKPILKGEFGLDDSGYAVIVNIFTVCYALMYPVSGWMVDKFGAKIIMFVGVITWSLACIGGGISRTVGQFGFFRGLLGFAEPTIFPSQIKVVPQCSPGKLRATANSLCQAGGSVGAILAPPIIAWLALKYNWHTAFIVMGCIGLLIAFAWRFIYKKPPEHILAETTQTSPVAKESARFTWRQLWKTRTLWGILLTRFVSDPVWYFCLFWLPGYLQEESGLSLAQVGMFGWIPFLAADLGAIGTAAWSDKLVRKGYAPLRARKRMLTTVACFTPLCVLVPYLPNAATTLVVFSLIAVASLSWLFTTAVLVSESFPVGNVASVLGIAGGCGALGAVLFNYFVGQMMGSIGTEKIFFVMALLHPISVLILWTMVRPERPKTTGTD
ncbi:MAG TPA: MFS transporter [Niabella sp.]|nr:MFS transporter [Niabella sp.]